ncbi:MAG TPA: terminase large subunit, partial [Povalibacter sp.]|nr:terminase large subunit [Povalibacter sp.]
MASHRVDRYAEAVLDREILAGPLVRLACERHRRDRQRAKVEPRWYQFSEHYASLILDFFETVLHLPDVLDEDGQPQPFTLLGCWPFVLGSLFGWVDGDGQRRFREGYIEAGKGSSKTPILAGVGLYGITLDEERAAEIYAAGSIQDQSDLLFRDAVRIAMVSPALRAELAFDGREQIWQIRHPASLSFFTTFSREGGRRSGPRPHMGLVDELHEHASPEASVKMRAGAKRRKQPLFLETTNSGFDRTSICWQRHEHARKVMHRVLDDEQFFAYVCALDACDVHQAEGRQDDCADCDQPLTDETVWAKTNPLAPVTPTTEYLRRQVANAVAI